jgi:murein DD-endopeptidase MepM/ murein hydrolase activator NlpD
MNIIQALEQPKGTPGEGKARSASPDELRRVAQQFEALLLTQLTSVLNKSGYESDDDPDGSLFGGDGGTGLAKQMFSEQLATTMSESGGMGLASIILRQLGGSTDLAAGEKGKRGLHGAISAFKDLRSDAKVNPLPNTKRSESAQPIAAGFASDPNDAAVISTFEDQARSEGIEPELEHLILGNRIVNTTRPRIAPNSPIKDITNGVEREEKSVLLNYQFPVDGRMSSSFGNRVHPIDRAVKFHAGLDLAVPRGTNVEAAAEGKVEFSGWKGGYGNLLVIKHPDGRETRYGHLEKILVNAGDKVSAGQQVALSGSTGKSTGPHLHFEIRENGQVLNPLTILTKGSSGIAER